MHAVDSNDISFKIAGTMAFREAFTHADPQLMEPIQEIQVPPVDNLLNPMLFLMEKENCILAARIDQLKRLGVAEGGTTGDGRFTVTTAECLGSCGTAPVMVVDDEYHENMDIEKVDRLIDMTAERFFAACRLNPSAAARSVREQAVDASFVEADAWDESICAYFDRYESLQGDEARLQASIHPMLPAPPDAAPTALNAAQVRPAPLFQPTWLLFADGQVADLRQAPGTLTDHARWVADALGMLDGLAWLGETQPSPGLS
jgi:(2Fe-2S) ferredoxin